MRIIIGTIRSCFLRRMLAAAAVSMLGCAGTLADPGVYQSPESFVEQAFPGTAPAAQALWLRADLREAVGEILDRSPPPRIRYWQRDGQTVWVLDEIGKDQPITAGVVVRNGAIENIQVLVFRESRGWEIKHPFFTRQFEDARLTAAGDLDQPIDGITGATLSVNAMTRMARAALLLDAHARGNVSELARANP